MKKLLAAVTSGILCLGILAGCGQTSAPAQESMKPSASADPSQASTLDISQRTIRFSTTSAEGTEIVDVMHDFADLVSEASGGLMTVEVHPGSALGDVNQSFQNVQLGVQEMAVTSSSTLASAGAKDFVSLTLPYVFRDMTHLVNVTRGEIGQSILASASSSGTKTIGIGFWAEGSRNFFSKTPIRSLDDIKGMKLRCQPLDIDTDMTKALGANPTPIAFGELYSALETGVVDGAENPLSGIYSNKFQEVCKYVTLDAHSAPPVVIVFSEAIWNTMSNDEQQIIMDSWEEASAGNLDYLLESEEHYIDLLEEAGCEVIELSDKDAWVDAMAPVYETYGADVTELLEEIAAVE